MKNDLWRLTFWWTLFHEYQIIVAFLFTSPCKQQLKSRSSAQELWAWPGHSPCWPWASARICACAMQGGTQRSVNSSTSCTGRHSWDGGLTSLPIRITRFPRGRGYASSPQGPGRVSASLDWTSFKEMLAFIRLVVLFTLLLLLKQMLINSTSMRATTLGRWQHTFVIAHTFGRWRYAFVIAHTFGRWRHAVTIAPRTCLYNRLPKSDWHLTERLILILHFGIKPEYH